jgi:hypothetical protein
MRRRSPAVAGTGVEPVDFPRKRFLNLRACKSRGSAAPARGVIGTGRTRPGFSLDNHCSKPIYLRAKVPQHRANALFR